jgi:hypothetical protein
MSAIAGIEIPGKQQEVQANVGHDGLPRPRQVVKCPRNQRHTTTRSVMD